MYSLIDSAERKNTPTSDTRTIKQVRSVTTGLSSITISPEESSSPVSPDTPIDIDIRMDSNEFKPSGHVSRKW